MPTVSRKTTKVGFLLPGIGISYLKSLPALAAEPLFQEYCRMAGIEQFCHAGRSEPEDHQAALQDTLDHQKLAYVTNCTICDLYQNLGIEADVTIGYSMGIYAALYQGGFYSFREGLMVLEKAFSLVAAYCRSLNENFGMGLVLGLKENEIQELLLTRFNHGLEIAVHNGHRSFVLAGKRSCLDPGMAEALQMGAIGCRPILTRHPYHTRFLSGIAGDFLRFLDGFDFRPPRSAVLSLIDAQPIRQATVAGTIVGAMHTPLHFDLAVRRMIGDFQPLVCYEAGPPKSMAKLARYVSRRLEVHSFEQ